MKLSNPYENGILLTKHRQINDKILPIKVYENLTLQQRDFLAEDLPLRGIYFLTKHLHL